MKIQVELLALQAFLMRDLAQASEALLMESTMPQVLELTLGTTLLLMQEQELKTAKKPLPQLLQQGLLKFYKMVIILLKVVAKC